MGDCRRVEMHPPGERRQSHSYVRNAPLTRGYLHLDELWSIGVPAVGGIVARAKKRGLGHDEH